VARESQAGGAALAGQEGLTGPHKQPQRTRLWLAEGSCIRRRAEYPNHVWSYDFVMDRTQDGRPLKMLTVMDAYTRECLAIAVRRRLTSRDVQEVLSELFLHRDCPTHIRSDNGPECIARALGELFYTLHEAQVLVERWRRQYNTQRPHRALGYRPPAPETRTFAPVSVGVNELERWPNNWGQVTDGSRFPPCDLGWRTFSASCYARDIGRKESPCQ
jgi:transposase InsO family protein